MDARHFAVVETLRNGTSVTIRSVRPDDAQRIVKAFGELERGSVYTRFFSYKRELSGTELAQLDTMDFDRDVMLVVTAGAPADEKIVASARYAGAHDDTDGKRAAEIAFIVEEDYQGLGIASRLLRHLTAIARDRGIARFHADVLAMNEPMLAVFRRSGLSVRQTREGGTVQLALELETKG
jgi:RimJ/RimL family protein N-acetyltransferase